MTGDVQPIILAAGRSTRMGHDKLAAMLGDRPIIAHVADAVAAAGLPPPIVVLGHAASPARAALAERPACFVMTETRNARFSASIRRGIAAVPERAVAALILLGDMPFVSPELLRRISARPVPEAIVVPRHAGRRGNPVLWGRMWFSRLMALSGEDGGRALLHEPEKHLRYLDWDDESICRDIDTPDALALARRNPNRPVNT